MNNSQQSRHILQPKHNEILQQYTRGTKVYISFDNKTYQGYICDYGQTKGYYKVRFEDCDIAEYDHDKITTILHKLDKNNLLQALAATTFDYVQAKYAKTQTFFNEPLKFTGGYTKAISLIKRNNYNQQCVFQGYNYAEAVID